MGTTLSIALLTAGNAQAFSDIDGTYLTCQIEQNGKVIQAAEINGTPPGGFHAYGTVVNGYPTIIYDVYKMMQLPIPARRFLFFHECAHLAFGTSSEATANCEGIREMRRKGMLSSAEEAQLRNYIVSLPAQDLEHVDGPLQWQRMKDCR